MTDERYEEQLVRMKALVSRRAYCDRCGREIRGLYFQVMTGHHDWGADSCDSIKHFDYCSHSCLSTAMSEYFNGGKGINDTAYFDISKKEFIPFVQKGGSIIP